jgi:hypothetical protein
MKREEIIDAILEINFKMRYLEESLAHVLEKYDEGIVLEKETDKTLLQMPPVTSLEGIDLILQRLDCIEDMVKCLNGNLALNATYDIARVAQILKESK